MREQSDTAGSRGRRWTVPVAVTAGASVLAVAAWLGVRGEQPRTRDVRGEPMPRYMLTAASVRTSPGRAPWFQILGLAKAARPRPVHSVPPPSPSAGSVQEIVAGPGGTFVAVASRSGPCRSDLHRFRLTEDGRATGIRPIPGGTVAALAGGVAISPDGRRLAFATAPCAPTADASRPRAARHARAALTVLDTTTGERRTWNGPDDAVIGGIVWAADGRTLGYLLGRTAGDGLHDTAVHALDTRAPGSGLRSADVLYRHPDGPDTLTSAVMNADGRSGSGVLRKKQPPSTVLFTFAKGRPPRVTKTIPDGPRGGITVTLNSGEPRYACLQGPDAFGRTKKGTPNRCDTAYAY